MAKKVKKKRQASTKVKYPKKRSLTAVVPVKKPRQNKPRG